MDNDVLEKLRALQDILARKNELETEILDAPKALTNQEELLEKFNDNILGVISDMSFMRNGKKDPIAGAHLGEYIKNQDRHIPLILESSEDSNIQYAHKLGASFISKNSKSYPQDLRSEITKHFGFGDFVKFRFFIFLLREDHLAFKRQ